MPTKAPLSSNGPAAASEASHAPPRPFRHKPNPRACTRSPCRGVLGMRAVRLDCRGMRFLKPCKHRPSVMVTAPLDLRSIGSFCRSVLKPA